MIPDFKLKEISSNKKPIVAVVDTWLHGGNLRVQSWRYLVYALDCIKEVTVADKLRGFAKPPEGTYSVYVL